MYTTATVVITAAPSALISYSPTVLCNVQDDKTNPPVKVLYPVLQSGEFSIQPATGLTIDKTTGTITPGGATPGDYTITYLVKGSGGCKDFSTTTSVSVTATPAAVINYPVICSSDSPVSPTLTGTLNGAFSSSAGLTIDPATGIITPSTSNPGTYTVTYTITPQLPCPGFVTTATVVITAAPSALISYSPTVLCNVQDDKTNPPVKVSLSGSANGEFSIQPATGLTIDKTTGTITPGGATPGDYTITYLVKGNGGCKDILYHHFCFGKCNTGCIYPIQWITFLYANKFRQIVQLTGNLGGKFSSTPGLVIDSTTGAIYPSSSIPGYYTISYFIAPSPPCPGYLATTNIEIKESPVINFIEPNQSICSGDTAKFYPKSDITNIIYNWQVVGNLPTWIVGTTSGTALGENALIPLSYTNSDTLSYVVNVEVTPVNGTQDPCVGTPYILTVTVHPLPKPIIS